MRLPTARALPGYPDFSATCLYDKTDPIGILLTTESVDSRKDFIFLKQAVAPPTGGTTAPAESVLDTIYSRGLFSILLWRSPWSL